MSGGRGEGRGKGKNRHDIWQQELDRCVAISRWKCPFLIEQLDSDSDRKKILFPVGENVNRDAAFDASTRFQWQVDKASARNGGTGAASGAIGDRDTVSGNRIHSAVLLPTNISTPTGMLGGDWIV